MREPEGEPLGNGAKSARRFFYSLLVVTGDETNHSHLLDREKGICPPSENRCNDVQAAQLSLFYSYFCSLPCVFLENSRRRTESTDRLLPPEARDSAFCISYPRERFVYPAYRLAPTGLYAFFLSEDGANGL